jgi:integrase
MSNALTIGPVTIREHMRDGRPTGRWMLDIPASLTSSGKRLRRLYSGRRAAEAVARELKRKLELRRLGFAEKSPKAGLSFRDACDLWVQVMELNVASLHLRPSSLKVIRTRLNPLLAFFGATSVGTITPDRVMEYQSRRLENHRRPTTINGELRVLRQLFGWLMENGHIEKLPRFRRMPEEFRRGEPLSKEDVGRLLAAVSLKHRALIRLMAENGLRPGEAMSLPWQHVDLAGACIRLQPFAGWSPKTRASIREVHLSPALVEELSILPRHGRYVFPGSQPDKPIGHIRSVLRTAADRANLRIDGRLPRLTAKLFRKAFASWQAERGIYPRLLQELMGHAPGSKVTDQHYVQVSRSAKRNAGIMLPTMDPTSRVTANALAKSGNDLPGTLPNIPQTRYKSTGARV